jgi:hypothetical protein
LKLNYDQFLEQNNILRDQVNENVCYEKIADVTRVDLPNNQFFFFKDGKLEIIYISDDVVTKKIWNEFKRILNSEAAEKTVRSRAGKTSNQLIFATQGVTVSLTNDDVDFIEIYTPCSLHEYLEKIYREVQPFIR